MDERNLKQLKEQLLYMGFGDTLHAGLEHHIRQQFPEFVLKTEREWGGCRMQSHLFFARSNRDCPYRLCYHHAVLKSDVGKREQTFDAGGSNAITLKESFNLLQGRAVCKDPATKNGGKPGTWLQLDFRRKEEWGDYPVLHYQDVLDYDLQRALTLYPIKELFDEKQTGRLLLSLQKGNLQTVTMLVEGRDQRFSIQASPADRAITVYDRAMRPLTNEQKAELLARKKINGKEVTTEGEQQGRPLEPHHRSGYQGQ